MSSIFPDRMGGGFMSPLQGLIAGLALYPGLHPGLCYAAPSGLEIAISKEMVRADTNHGGRVWADMNHGSRFMSPLLDGGLLSTQGYTLGWVMPPRRGLKLYLNLLPSPVWQRITTH